METIRSPAPAPDGVLRILYHGSIVPAQLPPTVLEALALLPSAVKLRIVGYETIGHRGYVHHLEETAHRLGLDSRFEYLGAVPSRRELYGLARECQIGIALFPRASTQPMPGASNKPFDYMACGLPLVVSDLPDWRDMFVCPGYGLCCDPDQPESIAEALRWLVEHPAQARGMGEAGRLRIASEWNYETQFAPVLRQLEQSWRDDALGSLLDARSELTPTRTHVQTKVGATQW
jgi:glycosyltransferase involved in cell wall biosynthesis